MKQLVWHSSFASLTGYSGSARAFVLGLDRRGVPVRPVFIYGADHDEQILAGDLDPRIRELQTLPLLLDGPQVVYAPGDRFSKNSGAYRIGFTMLEVDRLPPSWVEQANQLDELWTPTAWGAEVFRASGVERPVAVVPLGVDLDRFAPAPPRTHLTDRIVFLSIFEWNERKGADLLLKAYRAAFRPSDPVVLVLKIDCRVPTTNPIAAIAALLPEPSPPVVVLYNQPLRSSQLRELYTSADCFVLPTRGEGWGLPVLEAMACGLPTIATAWSGLTAFMTTDNSYPLPIAGLVPTGSRHPYYRDARWAEPDATALVDLLRHVADHPAERTARGRQATLAAQQWGWSRALDVVETRLAAI